MAINPLHEETVMFDRVLEGLDDQLVIAKGAEKFTPEDPSTMEHLGDKLWLPIQPIAASYDGFDQSANFGSITELAVPVTVGYHKSANFSASAKNMRNQWALNRYADAAKQKLASDINLALFNTVALLGTKFVKRTVAPTGYVDVAQADAALTEIGVSNTDRMAFFAPRVMNSMAGDLQSRQTMNSGINLTAYERAMINSDVAGFEVFKNDQSIRLAAATGGTTTVTSATYFVPSSYSTATSGEISNVDNRTMVLPVTAATYANIKVGDAFTIANVNSVHKITKQDTGQLQTFRVWGKPSAGNLLISPPIIAGAAGGGSKIEVEQQNVTAPAGAGAAITWLNTTTAELNPFFKRESLLLIPGSYTVEPDEGWVVIRGTTELGIALTYTRQGQINDLSTKGRWDIDFGTALVQPEMAGNIAFGQA